MAAKKPKPAEPAAAAADDKAPRGDPVCLYPLTPEQAIRGMFQISKEDVARIVASKPAKKKRGKK